jgi:hypothetical protein
MQFIGVDVVGEIQQFLPSKDFLKCRLVNHSWNEASKRHDLYWTKQFLNLKHYVIPNCHLVNPSSKFTIVERHPLLEQHPLFVNNKRKNEYTAIDISPETHTDKEIDELILNQKRNVTDPIVYSWMSNCDKNQSSYNNCCTIITQLNQLETSGISKEYIVNRINIGLRWHTIALVIELISLLIVLFLLISGCSLLFRKTVAVKGEISWNKIFVIIYAALVIHFIPQIIYLISHIYFFKARLHNRISTLFFSEKIIRYVCCIAMSFVTIIFLQLRVDGVSIFKDRFTVCCIPVFAGLAVIGIYSSMVSLFDSRVMTVLKLLYYGTIELVVVLIALTVDGVVTTNMAVAFIPIDIALLFSFLLSSMCFCLLLCPMGRYEIKKSGIEAKKIVLIYTTSIYLVLLFTLQIILSVADIPDGYSFLVVALMGLVYVTERYYSILSELYAILINGLKTEDYSVIH